MTLSMASPTHFLKKAKRRAIDREWALRHCLGVPNSFLLWNSDYFLEKETETLRTLHCGMAGKGLYSRHSTYRSFPDRNNVHTGPCCPTAPTPAESLRAARYVSGKRNTQNNQTKML